ncbi:MAG: 4Fe-4S binding protein [Candidatus Woesearchaeota archaeon]|jgi:ferredoxin|nr:4Fe-4S binding protein [Candidatus Woesearchaeota archaeon]
MVKRKIVEIDEEKCNGCGLCIPNCHEGALLIIDNKARLISDLFCDGLGNCLGHCPKDAITIVEREAEPYDEKKVMAKISKQGTNTVIAHLKHLKDHNETEFLNQAIEYLKENNLEIPNLEENEMNQPTGGCPGSKTMDFSDKEQKEETGERSSQLRQWPIQLHLVGPMAPYFQEKDVVIAADCVAYALADFHKNHLKGKSLAIACPKLDSDQETYIEKITALIDEAKINTLTVMIMEVPCCGGLLHVAKQAAEKAKRKIPIKSVVVGIQGDVLSEEWEK